MPLPLLFSIIAVIGAMPVFLLVASLTRKNVRDAQETTMIFLERWGGIAPASVKKWIRKTIGSTAGFALLVALTATFNKLGDGPLIPFLSGVFGHFGNEYTQWSEWHESDWEKFRDGVRVNWVKAHPDEDLNSGLTAWEDWKQKEGKDNVRVSRTLVFFSFVLATAGIVDLTRTTFRKRGAVLLIVGVIATMSFLYIWSDRKNSYVHNVVLANETLGQYKLTATYQPK